MLVRPQLSSRLHHLRKTMSSRPKRSLILSTTCMCTWCSRELRALKTQSWASTLLWLMRPSDQTFLLHIMLWQCQSDSILAPTKRPRLFLTSYSDELPIVWLMKRIVCLSSQMCRLLWGKTEICAHLLVTLKSTSTCDRHPLILREYQI